MALHEGTEGSIKVGPSASAVTVLWIEEWDFETTTELNTSGPFLGDKNKYKTPTGDDGKGSIKGRVPKGRDAGQTALMDAQDNHTEVDLKLIQDGAYTWTMKAFVTNVKNGMKASDGVPFECNFECSGGWTRIPTPTP